MLSFCLHIYSETFLILRRIKLDMIINVYWSSCTVPIWLSRFNKTSICSKDFRKKLSNIKFHENPLGGSRICSMRADRRTDMTQLIVAFRKFCERAEKCKTRKFYLRLSVKYKFHSVDSHETQNCSMILCGNIPHQSSS